MLIYIHGFNVSWNNAVGAALALQLMLQQAPNRDGAQKLQVVLFSWPSDGLALFFEITGFFADIRDKAKKSGTQLCGQDIHLLCHSMGNFLLQNALTRMTDLTPCNSLPRLFQYGFLCAPDVDDNVM